MTEREHVYGCVARLSYTRDTNSLCKVQIDVSENKHMTCIDSMHNSTNLSDSLNLTTLGFKKSVNQGTCFV